MIHRLSVAALLSVLAAAPVAAHEHHHDGPPPRADCPVGEAALRCATTVTPVFAPDGTLLVVWTAGGRVMLARSADAGATLGPAVAVNPGPEPVEDSGEARTAVAVDAQARVVVAYSLRTEIPYAGRLMVAHSADGGRSFAPPAALTGDLSGQRFPVMAGDGSGRIALAWIDKRGAAAAKRAGRPYAGAAIALARSEDGGVTFGPDRLMADQSCECCRLGLALDSGGRPVLLWRHVFPGGIRDHAVMVVDGARPELRRVSVDDWKIDGCPHHGGALAVDAAGTLHVAWYSGGGLRRGLFEARSADAGRTFSAPRPVGDPGRQAGHPQLLAAGGTLWLAWSEFDGERTQVMVQHSGDGGRSWSAAAAAAETADSSDRPLLVGDGHRVLLSWLTRSEGWRLLPLAGGTQ
jgi:hypothetical protein